MSKWLISLFLMILSCCVFAAEKSQLSVTGESHLTVAPDLVTLSLGVETYNENVQKAIQQNAQKIDAIRTALLNAGLTEKEIQTRSYNVDPRYSDRTNSNWQTKIVGYAVNNTLQITTTKIHDIGPFIDVAAQAGANLVHSITFSLQSEQEVKKLAITEAVQNAEAYAQTAAQAARIDLGPLMEMTINTPNGGFYKTARAYSIQDASTSISPQEIEVSANVSLIYALGRS